MLLFKGTGSSLGSGKGGEELIMLALERRKRYFLDGYFVLEGCGMISKSGVWGTRGSDWWQIVVVSLLMEARGRKNVDTLLVDPI